MVGDGLAGAAFISKFFPFLGRHHDDRPFPQGIVGVLIGQEKQPRRTGCDTIPASAALLRVNGDEVVPGGVPVSVLGKHSLRLLPAEPDPSLARDGSPLSPFTLLTEGKAE